MKTKELKNLAKKIANAELIVQTSDDPQDIYKAQNQIMELSSHVHSLDDITTIDEMVQEILGKILEKCKIFYYNIYIT